MAVTVHIPPELLAKVDEAASRRQVSRSRFVVMALERELDSKKSWTPEFLEALHAKPSKEMREAVEEMAEAIVRHRTSKGPPRL